MHHILRSLLPAVIVACLVSHCAAQDADERIRELRIAYQLEGATEVSLVWGVNGWKKVPPQLLPEGSTKYGDLAQTRMSPGDRGFELTLRLPEKTVVNYLFRITNARRVALLEHWDKNPPAGNGYSSIVGQSSQVNVIGSAEPSPERDELRLSFALPLLLALIASAAVLRFSLGPCAQPLRSWRGGLLLVFALVSLLALSRFQLLGLHQRLRELPLAVAALYYDLLYVAAITTVFWLLFVITRRSPALGKLLAASAWCAAALSVLCGFLNVLVIKRLGHPFNYQWLYYADFLRSADARNAMLSDLSPALVAELAALVVCLPVLVYLFRVVLRRPALFNHSAAALFFLAALSPLLLMGATPPARAASWEYPRLANPIVYFLQSYFELGGGDTLRTLDVTSAEPAAPVLSTAVLSTGVLPTAVLPAGMLPAAVRSADGASAGVAPAALTSAAASDTASLPAEQARALRASPAIRNVILYVMESTAARYLDLYGAGYGADRALMAEREHSAVFEHAFAHSPSTNNSMFSLVMSAYPQLSFLSVTKEHPDIGLISLPEVLRKNSFRTAFFSGGDTRFQNAGVFLRAQGFDLVADAHTAPCSRERFTFEHFEDFGVDGVDDHCLVDNFERWLKEDGEARFFSVLWTIQTHYPYLFLGAQRDFGVADPTFNRYLNALSHGDEVLGRLLELLEQRGLRQSTLVVVVGDHGEAFGTHDQMSHASAVYEENVRVPLVFMHPKLFHGERLKPLAGLIDVAPTIADLLGLDTPPTWQGRSLFRNAGSTEVYLFAPWSKPLFAIRDSRYKLIHDAQRGSEELYDLQTDPEELVNLAARLPEIAAERRLKLASWVQGQDRWMEAILHPRP